MNQHMNRLLLMNGPNINLLGKREKEIYGAFTLQTIEEKITELVEEYGGKLDCFQSNHEGELIDHLHQANEKSYDGIIFNPAAYTHSSISLMDAITSLGISVIYVLISYLLMIETF